MSADNFFYIDKHPSGGYAAEMGFASDDSFPPITDSSPRFETLTEAIRYAGTEYSEYGYQLSEAVQKELE